MQDVEKLERARAEMSDDMEQRLTRLSKKQEQKLKASDGNHEQVAYLILRLYRDNFISG